MSEKCDFVIKDGVLEKYTGSGGDVVIPNGVKTIGNWAFRNCLSLCNISIPDSVTSIGDEAFSWCHDLEHITIPESVTSIGDEAFRGCDNLEHITIPDSVTSIGDGAFWDCNNLEHITIPESVTSIGDGAFRGCHNLEHITIPESVTSIGDAAFSWCHNLEHITIPESVTCIGDEAFYGCNSLKQISAIRSDCKTGKRLFGDSLPEGLIPCVKDWYMRFTDGEMKEYVLVQSVWSKLDADLQVEIYMHRCSKTLLVAYMEIMREPDALGEAMLARISEKTTVKECNSVAGFLSTFGETTASDKIVQQLYEALKPLKAAKKALKTIEENTFLQARLNGDAMLQLSKAEHTVVDILKSEKKSRFSVATELKECYSLETSNLPRIDFADGTQAPDYVMPYLLTAHEELIGKEMIDNAFVSSTYERPGICENAQKVVSLLDSASLQSALLTLADENLGFSFYSKKMYVAYPICRYADDDTMNELLKRAPKWHSKISGNDAPHLRTFRNACLYNECSSVIMFADKYGDLDKYAEIRGTDAQTIRDTILADFGFDSDGRKTYDIGRTTIVVTLESDCSLSLFDTENGKAVKSIPKRGNDEALVATAAKDYADLKKNVKKVVKNRFTLLFSSFLNGTKQSADSWEKAYVNNPLLRTVANIVVWQQGKKTFILKGNQAIYADGTPYTIEKSPIRVAHPMEMSPNEVYAWQEYFTKNSLKQPFEQVWEPVIQPDEIMEDRYAGALIPYFRFMNQKKHGISVEDYDFHNNIEISFKGCNADVERIDWLSHMISPDDRFEVKSFTFKEYTRQVNHIVAYLDKATIYNRVINDDTTVAQYLHNLTLAQLSKFIELAAENNCPNVSAILLEYKKENFKDVDAMAEFTLEDW